MIGKILIANRGEIACRIAKTARRMGIRTVAVFSDADRNARHVEMADEAYWIGPAPARESYLVPEKIIDAARRSGAQAVHPGYGFLSENADFAQRCLAAGLVFIGPTPEAMRMMGSKAEAKTLMGRAGVPMLPGYHGEAQDLATLAQAAERIGFPVLVKASAGGGGRGMRLATRAEQFSFAVESARREALAAFGDDRLLIERHLARPRHVEIQLFADTSGNVVTFLERDCSLQRNHQKIVEESPAARLSSELRSAMRAAAAKAAQASGYVGAGTVEFLVHEDGFYFLEMNTRLQVEHPVTEMISGLDLVEWQIRVANGEALPLRQEEIVMRGCAMEARICAEDPSRDFLPATGDLIHLRFPEESANLRIDSGVRQGDRVSPFYDSLIAKLIVWDEDRSAAIGRLRKALEGVELIGVASNLDFLRALSRDPHFAAADYDTHFVERTVLTLEPSTPQMERLLFAAGAAAWLDEANQTARADDPNSPWGLADGWRLHSRAEGAISFNWEGKTLSGAVAPLSPDSFEMRTPGNNALVQVARAGDRVRLTLDGASHEVGLVRRAEGHVVIIGGRNHLLETVDLLAPPGRDHGKEKALAAPLPARVTRVFVKAGDHVRKGAPLLVLEAMKMEITVTAPRDGEIEQVLCDEGEAVVEGARLVDLAEAS